MSGSVRRRTDTNAWFVLWYDPNTKSQYRIYWYKGEKIRDKKTALKQLYLMQSEVENGTFILERHRNKGWSELEPFILDWLQEIKKNLSPATYKGYKSYILNHLLPFFKKYNIQRLCDIRYDVLLKLMNQLPLKPKGKRNVMACLHAILVHACLCEKIVSIPPFPAKKLYQLVKTPIEWVSEKKQLNILKQIPEEHQPIFYFLKYHLRRPAEAISLQNEDLKKDGTGLYFDIHRSVSARKIVDKTKTGEIHTIPCHDHFIPFFEIERRKKIKYKIFSSFLFINPLARRATKRYTNESLNIIWKKACKVAREDISLYSGLKHSSCCQYINEKGLSLSELQEITDHANIESVKHYAKTETKRKRQLMMTQVIQFKDHVKTEGPHE